MNLSTPFRLVLSALILSVFSTFAGPAGAQTPFETAAVVNDQVITRFDLDQRVRAEVALTGAEASRALANRVLAELVSATLRMQAAQRAGISPSEEEVSQGVNAYAAARNLSRAQLAALLASTGATDQVIVELVETELAWRELIRRRYGSRARATEADVARELELLDTDLNESAGGASRVYELGFLALNTPANATVQEISEASSRLTAARAEIRNCIELSGRANEFGPGSGVRGGIELGSLPGPLREAVQPLIEGQFTDPVRLTEGVVMALVCSIQTEDATDQQVEEIRRQLVQRNFQRYAEAYLLELRRDAVIEIR